MSLPSITLTSTSGDLVVGHPVTIGHVFAKGDVPSGMELAGSYSGGSVPIQTDVKTRYDDGSICHAILSFLVPTGASGTTCPITFSTAAVAANNTVPATVAAALVSGGYDVTLQIGATTVSAATALTSSIGAISPPGGAVLVPSQQPDLASALTAVANGGTIFIAAGTHTFVGGVDVSKFTSGVTILGAGAYSTIIDGQGGAGSGHPLSHSKGAIWTNAPNVTIKNIGFVRCGAGDLAADGEAGVYGEHTSGTLTVENCAFDNNENGIFVQKIAGASLLIKNCDFGRNVPNGQTLDGSSHDCYVNCGTVTEQNSRHYNAVNGHAMKTRCNRLISSGNFFVCNGGRAMDLPDGAATQSTSTNDTFVTLPTSPSSGLIEQNGESSVNGTAGIAFSSPTFYIGRAYSVLWNNAASAPMTFSSAVVNYYTQSGANPPSLTTQGPGAVTGLTIPPVVIGNAPTTPTSPLLSGGSISSWINGAIVTEFRVTAVVTTDLFCTFDIRAYANGNTRTEVIVSNDWVRRTGGALSQATQQTYTAVIKRNATTTHTFTSLIHYKNTRWRARVWTTTPTVRVIRDFTYMMRAGAVPPYRTDLTINSTTLSDRWTWYGALAGVPPPMYIGYVRQYMPGTGGRDDIGPLPGWTVMYMLTQSENMETITLGHGDTCGSVPWHVRSETTGRTCTIDSYPGMTFLWTNGIAPDAWVGGAYQYTVNNWELDAAHIPSLAYVPYLITGDQHYLDLLHAEANYCIIHLNPNYRGGAQGLLEEYQVRAQAWSLRNLAYASYATPDADTMKAYFDNKLNNNVNYYQNRYVVQRAFSKAGEVEGYHECFRTEPGALSIWQDDFLTMVISQIIRLEKAVANATSWLNWKINFVAGRFLTTVFRYQATDYFTMYYQPATTTTPAVYWTTWQQLKDKTLAYTGEAALTALPDPHEYTYQPIAIASINSLINVTHDARAIAAKAFILAQIGAKLDAVDALNPIFAITELEVPVSYGDVNPFVEWNYVSFSANLITMRNRGARNLVAYVLNSPYVRSASPSSTSRGVVGVNHIFTCECRLSGSTAGRARMFARGYNKLNGLAETASATVIGVAGTGVWTNLSLTFAHVPHNNPKLPDALTSLILLDHNGFGTAEFRNVRVFIEPV